MCRNGRFSTSLPVTAFRDYLQCPLRFYFKRVLQMRRFDARKAGNGRPDFGSVLHDGRGVSPTTKVFATPVMPPRSRSFSSRNRRSSFADRFGKRLNLPVRVQRGKFARAFAPVCPSSSGERESGWRIQCGELLLRKGGYLVLATLPIVGSLDRVDIPRGPERGDSGS
jgi:ATP-dependent helicase/nuclease subunit B